jgi:hypothetical protein
MAEKGCRSLLDLAIAGLVGDRLCRRPLELTCTGEFRNGPTALIRGPEGNEVRHRYLSNVMSRLNNRRHAC